MPAPISIQTKRLPHAVGLPLPKQMTPGSAGSDLYAAITEPITLHPGERTAVPTGLVLEIPEGYEGQVRPRSGWALKTGVMVPNAPGTIDSDYRGEVKVLLANLGKDPVVIQRGDRIAQLVVSPVVSVVWIEKGDLQPTARGAGGFGHTGD